MPASQLVVAGHTVALGGVIEVSGTSISIAAGASLAVIGDSAQTPAGSAITPHPVLAFAGSAYTASSSSDLVIDGQTLTKGGTIDVDCTQLSVDQAGRDVVIGTSAQQLSTPGVTAIADPVFTFDGSIYTAGPSSDFVIDGHTLSTGGVINVDGTRISYDQGGTNIFIGTSTQDLSTASITAVEEPAITLDGSTYDANSASEFVINGQTYAATGRDVVIRTRTEAVGLSGYIMSVFGSGHSSTLPVAFTAKARRVLCLVFAGLVLYMAG